MQFTLLFAYTALQIYPTCFFFFTSNSQLSILTSPSESSTETADRTQPLAATDRVAEPVGDDRQYDRVLRPVLQHAGHVVGLYELQVLGEDAPPADRERRQRVPVSVVHLRRLPVRRGGGRREVRQGRVGSLKGTEQKSGRRPNQVMDYL